MYQEGVLTVTNHILPDNALLETTFSKGDLPSIDVHAMYITIVRYSSINRKEILSFVTTRMDVASIILWEISQTEKNQ